MRHSRLKIQTSSNKYSIYIGANFINTLTISTNADNRIITGGSGTNLAGEN